MMIYFMDAFLFWEVKAVDTMVWLESSFLLDTALILQFDFSLLMIYIKWF